MFDYIRDKKIILGVTGSIAAYKSTYLVRELVKFGADVHVILTPSAKRFVSELTLYNLTRNNVIVDMFAKETQRAGAWHIELSHTGDLMLIAPCSATTLSKLANANCDTALVSVAISKPLDIPFLVAPAMDATMWLHPATQRNVETIKRDGAIIIPPAEGELSSGLIGPGRLPELKVLLNYISEALKFSKKNEHNSENIKKSVSDIEQKSADDFLNISDEPLQDAVDKDKWNAEYDFEILKKKS